MLKPEDKELFLEARPFVVGVVALLMYVRYGGRPMDAFQQAESFVVEFEKRIEDGN